jgi:hypothetical protein
MTMAANRGKLIRFLREQAIRTVKDERLTRFALKHLDASNKSASLWEADCNGETSVDDLANDIERLSTEDAEGIGGTNKYGVFAYFGTSNDPSARHTFRVFAEETPQEGTGPSESADAKGLTAQHMRFTEANQKLTVGAFGETLRRFQGMLDRALEHNEKLMSGHIEMVEVMQGMLSQTQERNLAVNREVTQERRKDALFQGIRVLGPMVVNRLAGSKVLPENTTPKEEIASQLMSSLSASQIEGLQSLLSPNQLLAAYELMEGAVKTDEKEDAARKTAEEKMRAVGTGEQTG